MIVLKRECEFLFYAFMFTFVQLADYKNKHRMY